jgi:hypothetical protein
MKSVFMTSGEPSSLKDRKKAQSQDPQWLKEKSIKPRDSQRTEETVTEKADRHHRLAPIGFEMKPHEPPKDTLRNTNAPAETSSIYNSRLDRLLGPLPGRGTPLVSSPFNMGGMVSSPGRSTFSSYTASSNYPYPTSMPFSKPQAVTLEDLEASLDAMKLPSEPSVAQHRLSIRNSDDTEIIDDQQRGPDLLSLRPLTTIPNYITGSTRPQAKKEVLPWGHNHTQATADSSETTPLQVIMEEQMREKEELIRHVWLTTFES